MINEIKKAFDKAHDDNPKSSKFYSYDSGETVDNFVEFYKEFTEEKERKPFLEELKEHNKTGRTCFCGESKFCNC